MALSGPALAALTITLLAIGSAENTDEGRAGPGSAGKADAVLAYATEGTAGSLDLFVTRIGAGSRPKRVASSNRDDFSPSWSPDGRRLAYRVNPARGDEGEVWVMRADGSRKRNLTRSPKVADWSPAWSPNGRVIAYFSGGNGGDIWVMRLDGSGRRNVTRNGLLNEYPTWSPNGSQLAFNSHRDGQFEIYRSKLDGSAQRNLTRHPAKDQWPAWSRDGALIAFMSDREGSEDVFVMRANGTGVRNLTRTPVLEESHPAWMPDGRLSFTRHGETGPIELWAFDMDEDSAQRLPTDAEPVFVFAWAR